MKVFFLGSGSRSGGSRSSVDQKNVKFTIGRVRVVLRHVPVARGVERGAFPGAEAEVLAREALALGFVVLATAN